MEQAHNSNLVLFGFDLTRIPAFLRQGWGEALQWPVFTRLLPSEPVRVRHPDGSKSVWPDGADSQGYVVANALVLPEELLLRRTLHMPFLSAAAQQEAIELALNGASPFPPEKTVWGWRSRVIDSGVEIELVMASREHVANYLAKTVKERHLNEVEVWAASTSADTPPVVLQGYGEARRRTRTLQRYGQIAALAALALVLLLALVASPVARMHRDVSRLNTVLEAVSNETAPALADRNALATANDYLQAAAIYAAAHPDPQELLGRLSTLLPDSVYLTRLELRGHTVNISGLAANAAEVMEILGAQPGFHEVRAPAAITRDPLSKRESFAIEFRFSSISAPPTHSPTLAPPATAPARS
jgi:general secretion pathway protein L